MVPSSLRTRVTLALLTSLVVGGIAVVAGARYLLPLSQAAGADPTTFRHAVWGTLALVAVLANAAGMLVLLRSAHLLGSGVTALRNEVHALLRTNADQTPAAPHHSAATPPAAPAELRPVHDAVRDARQQLHDLIDRVRLERDRHRAIVDSVSASVFAVDGGGRIIHANEAAARMFDRPLHALTGVVLSDLIAPDSLQMQVDASGTVTFHAPTPQARFQTTFRVFGGRAFPAHVSVTPLDVEGQHAWAVFVLDLSAEHQTLAEVRAAREAAEGADRAKSAFLARIGSEFRSPLEATTGYVQAVLRSRSSQLSDRDRHFLERVHGATAHLQTLVGDVLDLAAIEAGTIALTPERTDISAIATSVVEEFSAQVAGRPVLLERDIPEFPLFATVDPARVRQVLTNLLSNAIKFTARGTVRVTVCQRGESDAASGLIVRDTGIGIPLEQQSQLFGFAAVSTADATARYGRAGLGLALSRRLATGMGCTLSVESMPGAGSAFTLAFAEAAPPHAMLTTPHHAAHAT